jgi:hypothetical protein
MADYSFDAERFARAMGKRDAAAVEQLVLATAAVNAPAADLDSHERVRALVNDPAFQLK